MEGLHDRGTDAFCATRHERSAISKFQVECHGHLSRLAFGEFASKIALSYPNDKNLPKSMVLT
jgi:hypothetical protein